MVKRKTKSKGRSIQLKSRSRRTKRKVSRVSRSRSRSRSSFSRSGLSGLLDQDISVRSLLKYSGITLAFIIVLVSVFMLGRVSASDASSITSSDQTMQLSGETTQTVKTDSGREDVLEAEDEDEQEEYPEPDLDVVNLSDNDEEDDSPTYTPVETAYEYEYTHEDDIEEDGGDEEADTQEPEPDCDTQVAGFDYSYKNVGIDVSNFQRELRGDNWASLSSLKLTITNGESCTVINPTRVKIKMNARGKGSVWWDDDIYLSEEFKNMYPGKSVSAVIPVHVSYSDIYSEKDFKLALFDDYDIHMGTYQEFITFP